MIRPTTSAVPAAHILRLSRTQLPCLAARPTSALQPAVRHASTQPTYHPNLERQPKKGIKIGYLFSGLALLGECEHLGRSGGLLNSRPQADRLLLNSQELARLHTDCGR